MLQVELKSVPRWQLQFGIDEMRAASNKILEIMKIWKTYQKPGEVVNKWL